MRKSTLLKLALSVFGLALYVGVQAQTYSATINGDYVRQTAAVASYYTEQKAFTLYVHPDPVFSTAYNAADNTGVNASSLWVWNLDGLTAGAPWSDNTTPINENYVAIDAFTLADPAVAETFTVEVAEQFGVAGCLDASPVTLDVTILPKPTANIAGAAATAGWSTTTADHSYFRCGNDADGENLTITFTEPGVPAALALYSYSLTRNVYTIDGGGAETEVVALATVVTNNGIAAGQKYNAGAAGNRVTASGAMNIYNDGTNDYRTKYVFTLKGYTGAGSDGIVSQVSHKSDYTGAVTIYPFDGGPLAADDIFTVSYIINPTPVTGPIYHIPNSFNL